MAQLVKIPFIVFRLARLISAAKLAVKMWYTHSLALSYEPFICQEILILEELWPRGGGEGGTPIWKRRGWSSSRLGV